MHNINKKDFTLGIRNIMNLFFLDQICLQSNITTTATVSLSSLNVKVGDKLGYYVTLRNSILIYYLINLSVTTLTKASVDEVYLKTMGSMFKMNEISMFNNLERKFDKWSTIYKSDCSGVDTLMLSKYSHTLYVSNVLSHLELIIQ